MTMIEKLRQISPSEFAALGLEGVAYIRPVRIDGADGFAIFAADGTRLAIVPTLAHANAAIRAHDLEPISVQ
ncbi:MAG: DUF1150 family protein [Dongiaceae bacterium]